MAAVFTDSGQFPQSLARVLQMLKGIERNHEVKLLRLDRHALTYVSSNEWNIFRSVIAPVINVNKNRLISVGTQAVRGHTVAAAQIQHRKPFLLQLWYFHQLYRTPRSAAPNAVRVKPVVRPPLRVFLLQFLENSVVVAITRRLSAGENSRHFPGQALFLPLQIPRITFRKRKLKTVLKLLNHTKSDCPTAFTAFLTLCQFHRNALRCSGDSEHHTKRL